MKNCITNLHGQPADFSIIVPSFNKREYVKETLESILDQEGVVVELLIYDAGSSDGSWEIIESALAGPKGEQRISEGWVISARKESDLGQSHAINKGLISCSGRFVAWLNADDFYVKGALKIVKDFFDTFPDTGLVYGELDFVSESGALLKRRRSIKWSRSALLDLYCFVPQPVTFWRRNLIPAAGLLDVGLHLAMDYDYWLRISLYTQVGQIPTVLGAIRIMEGTKTGTSPLNAMPEALRVGRRHGARYFSKFRIAYWLWRIGAKDLVRNISRRIF